MQREQRRTTRLWTRLVHWKLSYVEASILVGSILLTGCTMRSPYAREGLFGGYTDAQVDTNVFEVSFMGNGETSMQEAKDLTLLRSAELTLSHGFTYFVIINAKYRIHPMSIYASPHTEHTIICFKEKPEIPGMVYDAKFVAKSLTQKYDISGVSTQMSMSPPTPAVVSRTTVGVNDVVDDGRHADSNEEREI
jgi:hypothetical protein